jgi:hypothetical protein
MAQHTTKHPNQSNQTDTSKAVHDNASTIALLEEWAREDATDNPAAITQAERELAELKRALNANRPPDRPVFP